MTILEALEFNDLYERLANEKLPVSIAYKLAKMNEVIQGTIKIYTQQLNKIIDNYAVKDATGKALTTDEGVKIKDECLEQCQAELTALQNLNSEDKIEISFALPELDTLQLTLNEVKLLMPYIK